MAECIVATARGLVRGGLQAQIVDAIGEQVRLLNETLGFGIEVDTARLVAQPG